MKLKLLQLNRKTYFLYAERIDEDVLIGSGMK